MSKCSHCGLDKNICRQRPNLTICQVECIISENKALKGAKLTCEDCGRTFDAVRKIEESRDELLDALKQISDTDCFDPPTIDFLITTAEALKERRGPYEFSSR